MNDRMLSLRLDMSTDETSITDLKHPGLARLTIQVLEDTLRKLRPYAEADEIGTDPPSWWQGSVISEGEVINYRWSDLSE